MRRPDSTKRAPAFSSSLFTGPTDLPTEVLSVAELEEFVTTTRSRILPVRAAELLANRILGLGNMERGRALIEDLSAQMRTILAREGKIGSSRHRQLLHAHLYLICNLTSLSVRTLPYSSVRNLFLEVEDLRNDIEDPLLRVLVLTTSSMFLMREGETAMMFERLDSALGEARSAGLQRAALMVRLNQLAHARYINDPVREERYIDAVRLLLPVPGEEGSDWLRALAMLAESRRLRDQGDYVTCLITAHGAFDMIAGENDLVALDCGSNLADLHFRIGTFPKALEIARTTLDIAERLSVHSAILQSWEMIARIYLRLGDTDEALCAIEQGVRKLAHCTNQFLVLSVQLLYGRILRVAGRFEEALILLDEMLQSNAGTIDLGRRMQALKEKGTIRREQERYDEARACIEEGLGQAEIDAFPAIRYELEREYTTLLHATGDTAQAIDLLERMIQEPHTTGHADLHRFLAQMYEESGNLERGLHHFRLFHETVRTADANLADDQLRAERILFDVEVLRRQAEIDRLERQQAELQLHETTIDLTERRVLIERVRSELHQVIGELSRPVPAPLLRKRLSALLRQVDEQIFFDRGQLHQIGSVESDFFVRLSERHPEISQNDHRFAALLRCGLSTGEIASILHITPESVRQKKYRLRKSLALPSGKGIEAYLRSI